MVILLISLENTAFCQFQDQGLVDAVVRTDFDSQTQGTSVNPLTYSSPCLFSIVSCGNSPASFASTNYFSQNAATWPSSDFWVLSINNETSYDQVCPTNPNPPICTPGEVSYTLNPGPLNQSLPRSAPGYGLMGFTTLVDTEIGEDFYRAHLVMNTFFANPMPGGIPFLGIGAQNGRGNSYALGQLNNGYYTYKKVKFTAKLWDFILPTPVNEKQPATFAFYIYALSSWGGKPRGVFLTLAHWNIDNSDSSNFTIYNWNWPVQESFYYPGAQWVFIDAEDVSNFCPFSVPRLTAKGQQIAYTINLYLLFKCASDLGGFDSTMPSGSSIEGIHWAVEMSGKDGGLWTSVHNMRMAAQ